MATSTNLLRNFPAFSSFSPIYRQPISSILCPNSFRPNLCNPNKIPKSCRLKNSQKQSWAPRCVMPASVVSCFDVDDDDNAEAVPGSVNSIDLNDSAQEVSIDLKLPRRSLLVQFTCNICGERSQRLINKLAYEKGTVYIQCAGCSQYHRLVDNLNLVVEYDFREDKNGDPDADQI